MDIQNFKENDLYKLSKVQLAGGEVHVWSICWKNICTWINDKKYILNDEELKTKSAFYFQEDKMRYMTGRILTRLLSAHYLGIESSEIVFKQNLYGKPFIVNNTQKNLYYNISHSGEYVLLAFTYIGAVGIDVEEEKWLPEYKDLAHNFHKEEYEKICETSDIEMFYRLWTAKEAYVKAVGKGLQIGLGSFYVGEDGIYKDGRRLEEWKLFLFKAAQKYPAAIVINTETV